MSTDESVTLIVRPSPHQDQEETENRRRIKLYRAALRGDWKHEIDPRDLTATISERKDTALHIGAMAKSCKFARKLLPKLDRLEYLAVRNKSGNTAFFLAAASGKLELAKEMVKEKKYVNLEDAMMPHFSPKIKIKENEIGNLIEEEEKKKLKEEEEKKKLKEVERMKNNGEYLAQVKGNKERSPLLSAVLFGHEEMVYWLYYLTKDSLNDDDPIELLLALIKNGFHELALQLLEEHTELATAHDDKTEEKETALHALAQLPVANQQGVWKRIKKCFNRYHTLQLLEKYKELSNQQGIWENIKKCFNRFLRSTEKQSPEMKLLPCVWEQAISSHDFKNSNLLKAARKQIFVAAERGNIEFLKILIHGYPDLIFQKDDNWPSIFHLAVKYRHEEIFRLIHEIGLFKDIIVAKTDEKGNNILHLAGMSAPPEQLHSVSGVALQMQRELLWFEEVKKLMNPFDAEAKNNGNSLVAKAKKKDGNSPGAKAENNEDGKILDADKNKDENSEGAEAEKGGKRSADETEKDDGKTPRALFSEQHKDLKKDGEKWMKDTANYCMVVAALITTVVFAAALAVPGGTNDETGTPHFLKKSSFKIFIVSDAISLVLSTCSILTFLSILTSRYAEEDFLEPLPRKLLVGLGTLLLSIAAMMVVFCAAIFILFEDGVVWIPILVAAIGSLPVIFFIIQQLRLFIDVLRSTYTSSSIFKPGKVTLFFENGKAMKS